MACGKENKLVDGMGRLLDLVERLARERMEKFVERQEERIFRLLDFVERLVERLELGKGGKNI